MIGRWSMRAEQLQDDPGASAGQLLRAACLEDVVRDLRARLAASPAPVVLSAEAARIAELEESLAAVQPYMHPTYKIMFGTGEIMDQVRWSIEDQLGRPRSAATGKPKPVWADAPVVAPTRDPEPFTAGPQMGLFV